LYLIEGKNLDILLKDYLFKAGYFRNATECITENFLSKFQIFFWGNFCGVFIVAKIFYKILPRQNFFQRNVLINL